jgi:hypothetical protein
MQHEQTVAQRLATTAAVRVEDGSGAAGADLDGEEGGRIGCALFGAADDDLAAADAVAMAIACGAAASDADAGDGALTAVDSRALLSAADAVLPVVDAAPRPRVITPSLAAGMAAGLVVGEAGSGSGRRYLLRRGNVYDAVWEGDAGEMRGRFGQGEDDEAVGVAGGAGGAGTEPSTPAKAAAAAAEAGGDESSTVVSTVTGTAAGGGAGGSLGDGRSSSEPATTSVLAQAVQCLRNALLLLPPVAHVTALEAATAHAAATGPRPASLLSSSNVEAACAQADPFSGPDPDALAAVLGGGLGPQLGAADAGDAGASAAGVGGKAASGGRAGARRGSRSGSGALAISGGSGSGGAAGSPPAPSRGRTTSADSASAGLDPHTTEPVRFGSRELSASPWSSSLALRQAALAKLAYAHLCLRDPAPALAAANALLELPRCEDPWRFLAHSYAAEALMLMGRAPADAAAHLAPHLLEDDDAAPLVLPGTATRGSAGAERGAGAEGADVRLRAAVLHVNAGVVAAAAGDMAAARAAALRALAAAPDSYDARRLWVYLAVRDGRDADATACLQTGRV